MNTLQGSKIIGQLKLLTIQWRLSGSGSISCFSTGHITTWYRSVVLMKIFKLRIAKIPKKL